MALSTASIDDSLPVILKDLADEGTRRFIDADNMRPSACLTGTIDEIQNSHADKHRHLKPMTAPFFCSVVC